MSDKADFQIRWLALTSKTREVYSLPANVPWPDEAPPPGNEDYFLNISALAAGAEFCEEDGWSKVGEFCRLCEEAGGHMENFDYNNALLDLEEAENLHPCAFVHWQRCICHIELKQGEQAMAAAYHASMGAPSCGVFWRVYGELCHERGLLKESLDAFEKAFFGGEHSPSVIASMRREGLLVPAPSGGTGDLLLSPTVASAIFKTHVGSVAGRANSSERLRELAKAALDNKTTAEAAVMATEFLVKGGEPSLLDKLLQGEALAKTGNREDARRILKSALRDIPSGGLSGIEERVLRLQKELPYPEFRAIPTMLLTDPKISQAAKRLIFDDWTIEQLKDYTRKNKCGLALVIAAEKSAKLGKTTEATELAEMALGYGEADEYRADAAKVFLECSEYEKVCATMSKVDKSKRGAEGEFLFGEALWRMGVAEQAGAHFFEALRVTEADQTDSLFHNTQMRLAQCQGLMTALPEATTLSPTLRLGRALAMSNSNWSSLIAPAGLPSSSYVRVKIEQDMDPCTYKIVELSRVYGEVLLGEISPQGKHDEICLAIEPSGRVFAGAKFRGDWVGGESP